MSLGSDLGATYRIADHSTAILLARLRYGEVWVIGYQADITTEEQIITDAVIKLRGQTTN